MMLTYEQWCEKNTNITRLARSLKSSVPEQYIGFYLHKIFGDEIEYQKQFEWLGRHSLDIFIPSIDLAIEYDGTFYHLHRQESDRAKTSICKKHNITIIRICEMEDNQNILKKHNTILYTPNKHYSNIATAITALCLLINEKYNRSFEINVDIIRDKAKIVSYVQNKYYKKTIACVWPESKDYWLEAKDGLSIYDVFYTDTRCFELKCPHCGKIFKLFTKYFHHRKSLIPCECEYPQIELELKQAIKSFTESGELITFDNSLSSRRLYDSMVSNVRFFIQHATKDELMMYKQLGFNSPFIDLYLSKINPV